MNDWWDIDGWWSMNEEGVWNKCLCCFQALASEKTDTGSVRFSFEYFFGADKLQWINVESDQVCFLSLPFWLPHFVYLTFVYLILSTSLCLPHFCLPHFVYLILPTLPVYHVYLPVSVLVYMSTSFSSSQQGIMISMCLQGIVDEILREKEGRAIRLVLHIHLRSFLIIALLYNLLCSLMRA